MKKSKEISYEEYMNEKSETPFILQRREDFIYLRMLFDIASHAIYPDSFDNTKRYTEQEKKDCIRFWFGTLLHIT